MALETLKGVKEIGGFKIERIALGDLPSEWRYRDHPIALCHKENTIIFKLQERPIKEVGVNGCQVATLIEAARLILDGLNEKFPCYENKHALFNLQYALNHLAQRKKDREQRGVEGTNQP